MNEEVPKLKKRASDAHKGSCGRVLCIAGSLSFAGAAALVAAGAQGGGAGYVQVALPEAALGHAPAFDPGVILCPQRSDGRGRLAAAAWPDLAPLVREASALVIGPGWSTSEDLLWLLCRLLEESVPRVIDADALNLLAEHGGTAGNRDILTPHPGEAARLLKTNVAQVQGDRSGSLDQLTSRCPGVVVLKGRGTLVGQGERRFCNDTGSAVMAAAGMGDVLAGLMGALLAVADDPFHAACQGVWAHGRAADLLTSTGISRGLSPLAVARALPRALKELES